MKDGGETVFPQATTKVSGPGWSDCAQQGLAVHTRRGDALLFFRCAAHCKSRSRAKGFLGVMGLCPHCICGGCIGWTTC